jgi:predicted outer membrane repeat protein
MSARPHLEAFEPRLLYSADALSLAIGLGASSVASADTWTQSTTAPAVALASQAVVTTQSVEIVVLDTSVADSASLLNDLLAQQRAGRHLEVLTLGAGDDGIARITDLLAQRNNISALHLLGHGADGLVVLGSGQLNSATLLARAGEVASWGRAFSADADFLIYGCDVAAGATGQQLVNDLATLTGTDVAASTDATGSSLRGSNWVLEDQTGQIETTLALSNAAQQTYSGSLATIVVTRFTDDNNAGSLRWAITQANLARSADTITLAAGTYVLSLSTIGGDANSYRDFDIASDVTIVGAGAGLTVIESQGSWRQFEVSSGSLNLSGVTLRGGSQTSTDSNSEESRGGSINVRLGATLVLSQSVIENSSAQNGGAIFVSGTATLTDVELRNNTARSDGGAIYDKGNTALSGVAVTQNLALRYGGGIYKDGSQLLTLSNLTLSGNLAISGAGLYSSATSSGSGSGSGSGNVTNVSLVNASVVNNASFGAGAGLYLDGNTQASVVNSLFAGNSSVTSQQWTHANKNLLSAGYNLYDLGGDGLSFGMIQTGDRATSDIKLGALANNGGITRTHALLPRSDAINAASNLLAPSTDQRNVARQGNADIGAFEYVNATPSLGNVTLTIGAGGTAGPTLELVDFEGDDVAVDVVNVTHGQFVLITNPIKAITTFTGADFYDGKVRFVHDATAFAPTFTLRARDALSTSANKVGTVYFTAANSAPVSGGPVTLASSMEDAARSITQAQLLANMTDANGDPLVVSNLQVGTAGAGGLTLNPNPVVGGFGLGSGLKGEYFNITSGGNLEDISLSGTPAFTRTEGIDFSWADGAPGPGVSSDHFAVRWSGYVVPPATGKYTFRTEADDGIRVWVNGNLLINAWDRHQNQAKESLQVELLAGTAYTIKVEYFEEVRGATARLQWQTPGSGTFSTIPTARLFDAAPTALPEWRFTPTSDFNGTVNFSYNVSDGRGGTLTASASLAVIPVNDAPFVVTNKLVISEGAISAPDILAADPDNPSASTLRFSASNINHGFFAMALNPSVHITQFTQQQLNTGLVRFVHDGTGSAPSYQLKVTDGFVSSAATPAQITFTAINDAPVFLTNTLTINNNGTARPVIDITDEESTASADLTLTVSNLSGGHFELDSSLGTAVTTFTLAQVKGNAVIFVHNGSFAAPSYRLTVTDAGGLTAFKDANVSFNNSNPAPVFLNNSLTLTEGDKFIVTNSNIKTTDANDNNSRLTITVTNLLGGYFEFGADPGVQISSFKQSEIDANLVRFAHDGSNTAPTYRLTVSDPDGASVTSLPNVSFTPVNDAPVITANGLSITEGGRATPWVQATDEDTLPAQLTFTVTNLSGGQFELVSAAGTAVVQFTQAQIDNGEVRFVDNGSGLAPAYSLSVSDGVVTSAPLPVNILSFTAVNDRPVFTQNSLTVSEGGSAVPVIVISDPDNAPGDLQITVSALRGGHFEFISAIGGSGGSGGFGGNGGPGGPGGPGGLGNVVEEVVEGFTYAQVLAGQITFVHDGSELTPSYTLTVTDGNASDISMLSGVVFTTVNDLPSFSANNLVIAEGGYALPNIKVTDNDNSAAQITILAFDVVGGRFELSGSPGQAITTFTQLQVDKGEVRFVDTGLGTAPSYSLAAADPSLLGTSVKAALPRSIGNVSFTAVNDAPVFTSNSLMITEGGVARPSINVTDEDHSAEQLTLTVSSVSGGRFEISAAAGVAITSFKQADLNAGSVRFVHDGSSAAPRYTLTATDSDGATSTSQLTRAEFTVTNDAPVFAQNALRITEGGQAAPVIRVTDEDNSAAELRFSVSALVGGRFELIGAPGVAIAQFTQAQLDAGAVQFVHDGSETVPGYALSVTDVEGAQASSAGPVRAYTRVNDAPVILSNQLRITEAGFAVPNISATDVDTAAEQLKFTVSNVSGGHFELASASSVGILSFTQAQVDAGAVRFVHDGSFDAPRYRLTVNDGDTSVDSDGAVTFTRLPAPPPAVVSVVTTSAPTTALTSTSTNTTTAAPSTTSAAKPTSASAADVLATRAAAAEMAAAEAAAMEAQTHAHAQASAHAHANSQTTAASNNSTAASSTNASDARDGVSRGTASASTNNTGAGVEVDTRWSTATVAAGNVNLQNLLFSGDANSLDWSSSGSSQLDHKLLDAVLGSSDSSVRNTVLDKAFERIREELDQGAQADGQAVAGSLVLSTSFSVGYVLWLARGGVLLASMASSIPAWATVDPLPVLSRFKARQGEGDDGFGGQDGDAGSGNGGEKADALERLFSKAKKVFSGSESAPAAVPGAVVPAAVAPAPVTATPAVTALSTVPNAVPNATQASGVTP